jgi:hypothetical protein
MPEYLVERKKPIDKDVNWELFLGDQKDHVEVRTLQGDDGLIVCDEAVAQTLLSRNPDMNLELQS